MSHLLQMRGLKHHADGNRRNNEESHLLQMRGLKLRFVQSLNQLIVASFTDAWIETL